MPAHDSGRIGRLPLRAVSAAGFVVLSAVSLATRVVLTHRILPGVMATRPLTASTPLFHYNVELLIQLLGALSVTSLAAAVVVMVVRVESMPWRKLALLTLLGGLAVRLTSPDTTLLISPKPDSVHYQLLAMRLVTEHSLTIQSGSFALPSRMPIGPSLVMALTSWFRPDVFGFGIFSIWFASILGIALVYAIGRRVWSAEAGIIAALLLSLSPLHIHYTRCLMGDVPWATLNLLCLYVAVSGQRTAMRYAATGFLLGLGMLFKPVQVCAMAAFGLSLFVEWAAVRKREAFWRMTACGAAMIVGSLPVFFYHKLVMGDWLVTGYHLYDLKGAAMEKLFSLKYIIGPPIERGAYGNIIGYGISLLGIDPRPEKSFWFFPLGLLLILVPFIRVRGNGTDNQRLTWLFCTFASAAFAGMFLVYGYQQPRFFLPVLPLWALMMAVPCAAMLARPTIMRWVNYIFVAAIALVSATLVSLALFELNHSHSEQAELTRVGELMHRYDVIVSDEDTPLATQFGFWRSAQDFIPMRSKGEPWYTEDPATWQDTFTVSRPFEGVVPAVERAFRDGRSVVAWMRYPHRSQAVFEELRTAFTCVPLDEQGVPGLFLLTPRAP